jgi:hypothetical protein
MQARHVVVCLAERSWPNALLKSSGTSNRRLSHARYASVDAVRTLPRAPRFGNILEDIRPRSIRAGFRALTE